MIILKAEHFHLPRTNPSRWLLHRYRIATHLISILLFIDLIIIIVYSVMLGGRDSNSSNGNENEIKGLYHTFIIILFVFWSLLFLFMLFTPFWARVTHAPTGLFLTLLVSNLPSRST